MSRKRFCLKVLSIAAIALSAAFLVLTIFTGALLHLSGDGTMRIGGNRLVAIEITSPDYPRGSLVALSSGSIPENTPVAVRLDGVTVLNASQLSSGVGSSTISREQILGGVKWCIPAAGWLAVLVGTLPGLAGCLIIPMLIIAASVFMLLRYCRAAGGFGSYPLPRTGDGKTADGQGNEDALDPFPELDHRLKPEKPAVSPAVKTLVITQTRAASSAIRSQKGEVRIYASGQEKVLPLSVGKRTITLGGYQITVDIAREQPRTEDVTRELPVMRRSQPAQPELDDTQKIQIIGRDGN